MRTAFKKLILVFIIPIANTIASADEGMWLYNDPPRRLLKDKYGFEPTTSLVRARSKIFGAV